MLSWGIKKIINTNIPNKSDKFPYSVKCRMRQLLHTIDRFYNTRTGQTVRRVIIFAAILTECPVPIVLSSLSLTRYPKPCGMGVPKHPDLTPIPNPSIEQWSASLASPDLDV